MLLIADLESIPYPDEQTGNRLKNVKFYLNKIVCIIIQLGFFAYELSQLKWIGFKEYLSDYWNYLEVGGILIFMIAEINDMVMDKPNDNLKILFVLTILLCLTKFIYLVRVF